MSLLTTLKGGGRYGVPSGEGRDPIGYLVAGLNRLAQSELLDRLGLRRQVERAVLTTTSNGFMAVAAAGRRFKRAGTKGKPGARVPGARGDGLFDLTPTEDEQMLVDVVSAFATERLRPAAAAAN